MRDPENLRALAALAPDFVGFIFFPRSKRYVGNDFDPAVLDVLPATTQRVGVFVNESLAEIQALANRYQLDLLQLHGDEPPDVCRQLQAAGHRVMKVFSVGETFDFAQLDAYEPFCDFFLFDTKGAERGGNGVTFDWSILKNYEGPVRFFLSGGIGPESAEAIQAFAHPQLYALDVNSRFEKEPGVKAVEEVKAFWVFVAADLTAGAVPPPLRIERKDS
ncbi:phosphoribosylanthranilate isomerase [Catalinimonas alkaloidigena]|uniref:N-(5'-phosphoribosyl)anthranilate isomerase n=1 Tax=Catalinimonas alkaloidigena TaxID=1075417 RepID=A0A1G9IX28_9BACT|nr:phosphoribosylanthranilate isomerase [Catalinimonas alkaloidigena]SDL29780.1 phosphoribosylanthranilate isomerase [Catalinimonas alkaloidigena]